MHNWQSILWIMTRVSCEEVDPDEKSLLVAQDPAIVSCVIHRLAALVALSSSCKYATVVETRSPSEISSHRAVQLLCRIAERNLNVAASLVERLLLQEPEKYVYMIANPAKLPSKADASTHNPSGAVEEFLRDVYVRSADFVDALRQDDSAFRLVFWAVSCALLSLNRGTVICAARAVGALAGKTSQNPAFL